MSKVIKQMEMDALKQTFGGVKNMVFLSATKLSAITENNLRLGLRKKNIRMQMVKNSLARRVFTDLGIEVKDVWGGTTVVAWGGESIKELSTELENSFKEATKKDPKFGDKIKIKTALAEGTQVTFEVARKMPTRQEAIGEIVGMILGPGSSLAALLTSPGGEVAGQVASIADKKPEEAAAPAAG
ncbi:MAG: 50S ribosomal protein L10 [Gemmataceae bacterium]